MADNFNIQTTQQESNEAGGLDNANPAMTYVDFANQIARNSQTQQYQQALIDQAKLALSQKQAAAGKGVNPEMKDYLSIDEATAELKAAGLDDDTIQQFVSSLGNQQVVSRQSLDTVIRKKQMGMRNGQPFVATDADVKAGKVDEEGNPLISGQSYQAFVDPNSGETQYIRAGGESLLGKQGTADAKQNQQDEHQLADLGKELSKVTNPSRGNFISQNIGRAFRALNEIHEHPDLPKPTLQYIQEEVGGIFMGGVPPESALAAADVTNLKQQINASINKMTGIVQMFNTGDKTNQTNYLISLLTSLYQSTSDMAKSMMEAKVKAYPGLLDRRPDDVKALLDEHESILTKGLSEGAKSDMAATKTPAAAAPAAKPAEGQPDINALAAALGLKKKAQ